MAAPWQLKLESYHYLVIMGVLMNTASMAAGNCFPAVFSLGDSKADTGEVKGQQNLRPYGETFPGFPDHRFSDGRLVIDWMQLGYNLPFLEPFLFPNTTVGFTHGANFAYSGASARPVQSATTPTVNLPQQFAQYKVFKAAAAAAGGNAGKYPDAVSFSTGLHVISIGENDYRIGYLLGQSFADVAKLVDQVVGNITAVVQGLYQTGARVFFIVGIAKDGCTPLLLQKYENNSASNFDKFGCLIPVDLITQQHNRQLKAAVNRMRTMYPTGNFIFGDYFNVELDLRQNASQLGFTNLTAACCGSGPSKYNYNSLSCATGNYTLCPDPSKYMSWDGIHLTDHFYGVVAREFLSGSYVDPPNSLTPNCSPNFTTFYPIVP